jgi:hypothetical protein
MNESPRVRGIERLSCATTVEAAWTAAMAASTLVPSEQYPCWSGGDTLSSAASRCVTPLRSSWGMSDRKMGT